MNTTQLTSNKTISGEFIVKNPQQRITRQNKSYQLFNIKIESLPIKVIAWIDSCKGYRRLNHGQLIKLEGQFEQYFGNVQLRSNSIYLPSNHDEKLKKAKIKLKTMMSWMPEENLQKLLFHIFKDTDFYEQFSTAPASLNHHHSYIGGLFVHSVDVAWQIFCDQTISENERYLGTVAGLLHDAGKIKIFSKMARTKEGLFLHHDQLNLEILAEHLNWLDQKDCDLGIALRYLLVWKPNNYDPIPKLDVYEKISAADRCSAGSG